MIIKFLNVKLNNFLSFQELDLNLENYGYTLVSGINKSLDDGAKSNGSGKSSIWDSICWVLTGETTRGTKDVINKFSNGGAKVEINFEIDSTKYKIIRSKEDKELGTNLKIYVNGVDKSGKGIRDTEKLLSEYLPDLTSQLIGSVIILGQGLPQRFTNNTPSGRKEVLETLSKSDFMIEDIKSKLNDRKSTLTEHLREYENSILSNNSKLKVYENNLSTYEARYEELSNNTMDFDAEIQKLQDNIKPLIQQENDALKDLESKQTSLDSINNSYTDYNNNINMVINQMKDEMNDTLNTLNNEYYSKEAKYKSLIAEINKYNSVTDTCPTCGQKLPNVHKINTSSLEEEASNLKSQLNTLVARRATINENFEKTKNAYLESTAQELNNINEQKQQIKQLYDDAQKQINDVRTYISNIEKQLIKLNMQKESFHKDYIKYKEDIANTKDLIVKIQESILYDTQSKEDTQNRLDVVNKMLNIASRDFRGFLLSSSISFIEQKAKEYSQDIFDTDKIKFELDGNNLYIGYNDKQYENLSGGEKQKVDLIIQFAIRDMLSKYLNFSSNIIVLDEIFDNLDDYGCQKVLNLITNKLSDIESIFIITHHSDISIPYDNEIIIEKGEDNISRMV